MPEAGASARPARRYAAPWWEELDREAFREFPAARQVKSASRRAPAPATRSATPRSSAPAPAVRPYAAPASNPQPAPAKTRRGAERERNLPVARPALRRHERPGFRPDRAAMWAVFLGLFLILVAAVSAHAAVVHHVATHLTP